MEIVRRETVLDREFVIYGTIDEPLFLAQDVAKWIEHSDVSMMVRTLDEDEKITVIPVKYDPTNNPCMVKSGVYNPVNSPYRVNSDTNDPPLNERKVDAGIDTCYNEQLGQVFQPNTPYTFLTEDGLYEVLMLSRKPIAKQFKKQVKVILKEIRKTGSYSVEYAIPQTFGEALQLAGVKQLEVERLEIENQQQAKEIEAAQPALDFVDQVHDSKDCVTVNDFAKMIGTGRNKLFKRLKELGYLMRDNRPYQKYINSGVFRVVEKVVDLPTFEHLYTQTLITPHGQTYLHKKLKTAKELQLW
jgi:anti-repressor protein